jgi:cyclomaltodextrinase / maltogenic alpha-amylase / neopullulanase
MNHITPQNTNIPEWAKGIVWYQIFPERFYNGDPANDPVAADQKGAWPHDHTSPLSNHPWTSDWYHMQPWERENGRDIWFNLQRRRYGGDLQGIISKLGYLQDLGVGALYLNPVFESPSHHKYDGSTYHHIDPNFGPDPAGDRRLMAREVPHDPETWVWTEADKLFLGLVREVHNRGMYIIIDGVFNHMGLNSWVYRDVLRRQRESPYRDWLAVESWAGEPGGFRVRTWQGFNELPEWKQIRAGITGGPKQYIFDITRRWMDPPGYGPGYGIDGWRLDVAHCIRHPFWKSWRRHVKSINADAYLVAEVIDSVKEQKAYLKGDEFDAVMNYNFTFACAEFFIPGKNRIGSDGFHARLNELYSAFPGDTSLVMQNLLGSHDTDRIASRIANADRMDIRNWNHWHTKAKGNNPAYDTSRPAETDYDRLRLMVLFQMTWPGAPMVYYGDEAGMWGANDPCCRKPMLWPEFTYDDEAVGPDQRKYRVHAPVQVRHDLFDWHKKLIRLRNEHEALRTGSLAVLTTTRRDSLFAFIRGQGPEKLLIIVNAADEPEQFSPDLPGQARLELLAMTGSVTIAGQQTMTGNAIITSKQATSGSITTAGKPALSGSAVTAGKPAMADTVIEAGKMSGAVYRLVADSKVNTH